MNHDSKVQRRRRYKLMQMEQDTAAKLKKQGWEIYSPTFVCDRVGIKDGKIFLIEFKKPNQKLTKFQDKVRNLFKNYMVVHY